MKYVCDVIPLKLTEFYTISQNENLLEIIPSEQNVSILQQVNEHKKLRHLRLISYKSSLQ